MPERGYIKFYRSVFEHPVFKPEPFTEREAWTWLCCEAAWKPRRQRLGEHLVELGRGEVVGAVRFLAEKWGWSKGKVERYLERIKNDGMIETQTGTGITVITICNYDIYQGDADDDGTATDSEPGRGRDGAGTGPGRGRDNRKKLNTLEERKEGEEVTDRARAPTLFGDETLPAAPKAQLPDYDATFKVWYECYPKHVDPKDAKTKFIRVLKNGEATFEELMEGTRRYRNECEMDRTPTKFIKAPAVFLNKGSWKNEAGTNSAGSGLSRRSESFLEGILAHRTIGDDHEN